VRSTLQLPSTPASTWQSTSAEIEVDYGVFDGQALRDVPADVWREWRADPTYRPRGARTLAEAQARVGEACEELFAPTAQGRGAEDGDVVVVSHVSPIKAAVSWRSAPTPGWPGASIWRRRR